LQSYIEGLAKGVFTYDLPRIVVNESKLEIAMEKDEISKGSFSIRVCDDRKAEGFVYSSSHRMTCLTPEFSGTEAEIEFEYNSFGLNEGTSHTGRFSIVSDAGEYEIPYEVLISKNIMKNDKVSDLDNFVALANTDWYEAYEFFSSEKFAKMLLKSSEILYACYKTLCSDGMSMQCMEEFLIGIKAKEQVEFEIEENGEEFKDMGESIMHSVKVRKSTWGFIKLVAETDADFITLQKNVLTTEDFIGSTCNIDFIINYHKLHTGTNYGRIRVYSPYESQEYLFRVIKGDGKAPATIDKLETRQNVIDLTDIYVRFRLNDTGSFNWAKDSLAILNRLTSHDPDNEWYGLLKAFAMINNGQSEDAIWITDNYKLNHNPEDFPESWAFYLYIMTFIEQEEYIKDRIRNELEGIYRKNPENWILDWIKIHVNGNYVNNTNDRYRVIRECLRRGCNSPLIYAEAALTLNANPLLICGPEDTEFAILHWMMRRNVIGKELGEQFLDQLAGFKVYDKNAYDIASYICDKYKTENNIRLLCSYLIRMDKTDRQYNKWYRLGIEYDFKITRLYEYYILSVDESLKEPLPKVIYMYFRYNSNIDNRKKAFLYANLIANKDSYPEIFKSYQKNIEQFMSDQFFKGVINDNMAVIYNEFFYNQMILEDMEDKFVDILSAYRLEVEDESLTKVTVIYNKLNTESTYAITEGKAIIHLYSEDYIMIFGDGRNNYMSDVAYFVTPYVNFSEFMRKALRMYGSNEKLIVQYFEHPDRVVIPKNEVIDLRLAIISSDNIKESYKVSQRSDIIDYFYNTDSEYMEECLTEMPIKNLPPEERIKLAEVLMIHRYYEQAYKLVRSFGYESIGTDSLLKLATFIIEKYNYEPRDFLTSLCHEVYLRDRYNEQTLKYLNVNFRGNTKAMYTLCLSCDTFGIDCYNLRERIIKQVLFTDTFFSGLDKVFDDYFRAGASDTVKNAYLHNYAYAYLVRNRVISPQVFDYIFKEYTTGEKLHDVCKLALIKHFAEGEGLKPQYADAAKALVEEYYYRGIYLRCMGKIASKLNMKLGTGSKTTIEYITNPNHKVEIHYIFNTEDYVDEEMENVFEGIFVKEFTMFFGENVQYYITEWVDDKEQVMESGNLKKTDLTIDGGESSYDVINDILFSLSVKDDTTTIDLMRQYDRRKNLSKQIFTVM